MGFDATSGEGNTTGQPLQTQALSFAGSTAKPQRPGKMEEPANISRNELNQSVILNPSTSSEGGGSGTLARGRFQNTALEPQTQRRSSARSGLLCALASSGRK